MVELLFIRIRFRIGFTDALRDDFGVTILVACILAVLALHAGRVFHEVATQRTAHDTIELLKNKLMPILFLHLFLALPDGTFTIKAKIEWSSVVGLFSYFTVRFFRIGSQSLANSLKLIDSLMLPTGSKANHASIMLGSLCWLAPPEGVSRPVDPFPLRS